MPILELKTIADFKVAYPLVNHSNPGLTKEQFRRRLRKMLKAGYRCIAYLKNGEVIGLCGFWYGTRFWCGDFIDLDNLVVVEKYRSKGIGKKMTDWVEKEARRLKCDQLGLDTYITAKRAHRFYHREGYIKKGYHMIKPLK